MACCDKVAVDDRVGGRQGGNDASEPGSARNWLVRPMRHEDIDRCLEIWLQVELTEARVTVASALTIDPAGLYVAELKSNGEVIGMCSGVLTRDDTAFMGFYAVTPEYQGIGIGRELWARTMARIEGSITNVGLYGVPGMSQKYKKSGFRVEDSIRMLIFESEPGQQLQASQLKCLDALRSGTGGHSSDETNSRIELLAGGQVGSEETIEKLIEYDSQIHGHSRYKLLRNYLLEAEELPMTVALVRREHPTTSELYEVRTSCRRNGEAERKSSCCSTGQNRQATTEEPELSASVKSSLSISDIAVPSRDETQPPLESSLTTRIERGEKCSNIENQATHFLGYGCIRHDNTGGAMIGPLYAESRDACEVILRALIERFNMRPGGKYSVMSLTSNEQADRILRQIGFQEMDQCSRMFTRFIPEASLDRIYYVHSPNFTLF